MMPSIILMSVPVESNALNRTSMKSPSDDQRGSPSEFQFLKVSDLILPVTIDSIYTSCFDYCIQYFDLHGAIKTNFPQEIFG